MSVLWRVRDALPPSLRPHVRRVADLVASPVSSLAGARAGNDLVGLTFDDGPDPGVTPSVLDHLDRYGMTATFFVLTDKVEATPELVLETARRGHEIALHGDRHDRMTTVRPKEVRYRLARAKDVLESAVGRKVLRYRPPFGAQSLWSYRAARACGLDVVVWGPYAAEWEGGEPRDMAARAQAGLISGSILLMHDGLEVPTGHVVPDLDRAAGVEQVFASMRQRGLGGVSVAGLLSSGIARRTAWFRP